MNIIDYKAIESLIVELGRPLPKMAGRIVDIGRKKKYLTEQDLFIESEIARAVKKIGSWHEVFAEELHNNYKKARNVWIIDPISNTKGFINGWHHYAIVLSHLHEGELLFAAVYDPSIDELFTAYKDKVAYLNGNRVKISNRSDGLYFLFPAKERKPFTLEQNAILLRELIGSLRNIDSVGLHYCYVACGRADCAITINKDSFLEFAGKLILEEAGGVLTDFYGEELSEKPKGVIACRKDLYPKILNIISKVLER